MIDFAAIAASPEVSVAEQNAFLWRFIFFPQRGHPATSEKLDRLLERLDQLSAQLTAAQTATIQEIRIMSDAFQNEIAQLQADVAAQGSVIASATIAFQGLASQIAVAEQKARDAGATDAQIAAVAAVRQGLEANTEALSAAIPQNTPAADTGTIDTGTLGTAA